MNNLKYKTIVFIFMLLPKHPESQPKTKNNPKTLYQTYRNIREFMRSNSDHVWESLLVNTQQKIKGDKSHVGLALF